jgi:hypothetical protein
MKMPPKSKQPALQLYRHTADVTGLAQVTDDRVVSSSRDGLVRSEHAGREGAVQRLCPARS